MNKSVLEHIASYNFSAEIRSMAYAALTLTCLLEREWMHYVAVKNGSRERILRPAGETFGPKSDLQTRLDVLINDINTFLTAQNV